ncbi:unnamed protein product [Brassica rapa]|uniref:Uncharacterized protein n=1 Tax=Brassica campestris TaxID=3711 RepID=A0A8D9LTB0_BRACM|nr:unnamed protein product [Brassica rapa]
MIKLGPLDESSPSSSSLIAKELFFTAVYIKLSFS